MGVIIQQIISYIWLFATLVFLWLIWRGSATRAQRSQDTLIEATRQSTEAARKAAEAAQLLATYLERKP